MIKVAGVQFTNDVIDGGKNRQEILKELYDNGQEMIAIKLDHITRKDGSVALKVREASTNEVIGWIHTETANALISSGNELNYVGFIGYHGTYHVKLDDMRMPEELDIKRAQLFCIETGAEMPICDTRAYVGDFAPENLKNYAETAQITKEQSLILLEKIKELVA